MADKSDKDMLLNTKPCDILYFDNRKFIAIEEARSLVASARKQAGKSAIEVSRHDTADEAREAGASLLRQRDFPPGWAVSILGGDAEGWRLVRYKP